MINNIIGTSAGAVVGIKLVNGKFRPKYGIKAILTTISLILIDLAVIIAFIYGIVNLNVEFITMSAIGSISLTYLILINPYCQNSNNYYIKFQAENTLYNFELYYKNKKVNILYRLGEDGKITFLKDKQKLECVTYADGTQMSKLTKYKIINYFSKWLATNNLLSKETTLSLE